MPLNILDRIFPKKEIRYVRTFSLFAWGWDVGLETQVEIFFVRVWRNIQLYLTSTDGRGREGVIQISYNWSLALIYIANFTSHNFSLRGAGGLFGITPYNETEYSSSKTSLEQLYLVERVSGAWCWWAVGLGRHIWLLPLQLRGVWGVSFWGEYLDVEDQLSGNSLWILGEAAECAAYCPNIRVWFCEMASLRGLVRRGVSTCWARAKASVKNDSFTPDIWFPSSALVSVKCLFLLFRIWSSHLCISFCQI